MWGKPVNSDLLNKRFNMRLEDAHNETMRVLTAPKKEKILDDGVSIKLTPDMDYSHCVEFRSICKAGYEKLGYEYQANHLQEECGELIAAVNHLRRKRPNSEENLLEELVDVKIQVEKVLNRFDPNTRTEMFEKKIAKTLAKLKS